MFKKNIYFLLGVAFILVAAPSCKSHKKAQKPIGVKELSFRKKVSPVKEQLFFEIMDAKIKGDTLFASVRYGGGCGTHRFELLTDGQQQDGENYLQLYLLHEGKDKCRALQYEDLEFSIAPLKGKYKAPLEIKLNTSDLRLFYN